MEQVIHFILDTAGIGGLILSGVLGTAVVVYILLTRWILRGGREDEARPTSLPAGFTWPRRR